MSRAGTAAALAAGALFGAGLEISGMARPEKVRGFLDVTRVWDPSLAFVMLGAVGVYFVAWRVARRRDRPLLAERFDLPAKDAIDGRLVVGAAIFGVGWGVGGFCPGPAIVAAGGGASAALVFLGAMTVGWLGARHVARRLSPPASPPPSPGE